MIDLVTPDISQVKEICAEIHRQITAGKNVYVHCALGIFRTIFVASSYLIIYEKYNPSEVIEYLATLNFDPRLQAYIVKNKARYERILLNL